MGLMAFALTVVVIINVAAIYIYFSRQALRQSLNDDRSLWPGARPGGWRTRRRRAWLNPVASGEAAARAEPAATEPDAAARPAPKPAEPVAMADEAVPADPRPA